MAREEVRTAPRFPAKAETDMLGRKQIGLTLSLVGCLCSLRAREWYKGGWIPGVIVGDRFGISRGGQEPGRAGPFEEDHGVLWFQ